MFLTYVREAVRSLYTAKQRTLLALIGISIAIGAVIALVSIGIIWGEEMLRKASEADPDVLKITVYSEKDYEGITLEDAFSLLEQSRTLTEVLPVIHRYLKYNFRGEQGMVSAIGTIPLHKDMSRLRLQEGRFISPLDKEKPYVVVGAGALEKKAFKSSRDNIVGSVVKLSNRPYTIIGMLESTVHDWLANRAMIMPISTATRYLGVKHVHYVLARMRPNVDFRVATKEIKEYFKRSNPRSNMVVRVQANEQKIEEIREQASMQTLLLGVISIISLLVGGVGIMNVMLTSVIDRRREIGILRAIGARQRDIRRQFLTEAVILSLIGGVLGAGIGVLACYIVCSVNEWTFFVPKIGLWLGLGVSSLVGIFFGFYPAHKAAKLDPITALRSE
ncbi:MAG: ABC transporter permease [Candidatus Electrothrix aestuarii]|uniref:ABC transporter permease n=1 Tax=Candidatus Electrothrix aestuarii TaxID=3062594 RepID=A0AAU8M1S7_9BACT|nr:FtsX-like permease family protein [Candidatus Electrothrix aestuarii]